MAKDKILFISQEIAPYVSETAAAVMGRDVPQAMQGKLYEVRTFMPRYGSINERRNQLHEVIRLSGMNIVIDDADHPLIIKVATLQPTRMQVYFIDNDDYFQHQPIKDLETDLEPELNDERLIFYAYGVIETARKLRWDPKVMHCVGWITTLVPLYMKLNFADEPTFAQTKVIFTISDENMKGTLDPRFQEKLLMAGFTPEQIASLGNEPVDNSHLSRLAIDYADAIVVATPNPDADILEYAKNSGKPLLEYPADGNLAPAYIEFYKTLES